MRPARLPSSCATCRQPAGNAALKPCPRHCARVRSAKEHALQASACIPSVPPRTPAHLPPGPCPPQVPAPAPPRCRRARWPQLRAAAAAHQHPPAPPRAQTQPARQAPWHQPPWHAAGCRDERCAGRRYRRRRRRHCRCRCARRCWPRPCCYPGAAGTCPPCRCACLGCRCGWRGRLWPWPGTSRAARRLQRAASQAAPARDKSEREPTGKGAARQAGCDS
jgi:hypothetical protein